MSEEMAEAYWEAIARSRDVESLRKAIASDRAMAIDALSELSRLLVILDPLVGSALLDQLRWLGMEMAEVTGERGVRARLRALRAQSAGMEALLAGDKARAVENLSEAAAVSLEGDSIEEAIRTTHGAVVFLFRVGEMEAGLRASEALVEALAKRGFENLSERIALYEFTAVTKHAPAGHRWAQLLVRVCAGMKQAADQTLAIAVSSHLAATLIRCGAYEEGGNMLAEIVPVLSRLALKRVDGTVSPLPEATEALVWRARALDLSGHEAEAENAYFSHPSFEHRSEDAGTEVVGRLAELFIANNRLQEAMDLMEECEPKQPKFRGHAHALISIVYALLNRRDASLAAAGEAADLLKLHPEKPSGASPFQQMSAEGIHKFEELYVPDEMHWRIQLVLAESAVIRRDTHANHLGSIQSALAWARQFGERAIEARCLKLEGETALISADARTAVQKLEAALECELTAAISRPWQDFGLESRESMLLPDELRQAQTRKARLEAGVGSETLLALGRAKAAAGLDPSSDWDAAIAASQRRNRRLTLYYALVAKAQWLTAAGRRSETPPLLESAVGVLESLRADLADIESQIGVLEDKEAAYGELLLAAVESADGQVAMRLMERAKARALLEEMGARDTRLPLDVRREQEARGLRQNLVRLIKAQMEGVDVRTLELERLKDQFAALYRKAGGRRSVERRAGSRAADVAQLSIGGDVVLEYFVAEEYVIVAVARNGELEPPVRLSCNKADLTQLLETFQFEISTRERCHSLAGLYSALIRPVEKLIDHAERIILVPHGILHTIPMHALQGPDGAYLAQRFTIYNAPSVAVTLEASRPAPHSDAGTILVAANRTPYSPLPELRFAAAEVDQVSKSLPGAEILKGLDALRRHIVRRSGELDILHLACHGEFDHHDPLLSRVYLADGPLYGYEIERLACRPRLAVLSACETAVQRRAAGDETFGLVRAFLSRGSETVIASLWKVADESTAMLMGAFYRHLSCNRADVASSLRKAQMELLSSPKYAHPFFWAPYLVIGGVGHVAPKDRAGGAA